MKDNPVPRAAPSRANPRDPEAFLARRRTRLWHWLALGVGLILVEAAFFLWLAFDFKYVQGCWEVMREMELSALGVPPWQTLSIMIPFWIGVGILAYSFTVVLIFRVYGLERRYQRATDAVLGLRPSPPRPPLPEPT